MGNIFLDPNLYVSKMNKFWHFQLLFRGEKQKV